MNPGTHDTSAIAAVATAPGTRPARRPPHLRTRDHHGPPRALRPAPGSPGPHHARLRLSDDRTLPVLLLRFLAPASYTGEDAAEIITVANRTLLDRIMTAVLAAGGKRAVRQAGPGEFTARAFLNSRLTLDQAEGVAATIAADSNDQLHAADRLLSGQTGRVYHAWAEELATLLALVEAGVDFTEQEDVVPIPPDELLARLGKLTTALRSVAGDSAPKEHHAARPRVVLVGPPNAGKSTLFNTLLSRPRAVVSDWPGTTRDALEEPLDLSRVRPTAGLVTLVDLAGFDAAPQGPIDHAAQRLASESIQTADLVIHCDPTGRFEPIPGVNPGRHTLRVRTKADLPLATTEPGTAREPGLEICALDGYHLPALQRAIADLATAATASAHAGLVPRHRLAITAAADHLLSAAQEIEPGAHALHEPELVAGEMRLALNALAELTGDISPDDVLGRVFATFCVGK